MWLKLFLLFAVLIVSCNGYKDTSCNFSTWLGWCGWYLRHNDICRWVLKPHDSNSGYIYLKGARDCSSSIERKFSLWDSSAANYLTIEYYVKGPGPYQLQVLYGRRSPDTLAWSCSIQPGDIKRKAYVYVPGSAFHISITGKAERGSYLVINQIWDDLQGEKSAQRQCPTTRTTTTTTLKPTTTTTTTTTPKPTTTMLRSTTITTPRPASTTPRLTLKTKGTTSTTAISTTIPVTVQRKNISTETSELNPSISTLDSQTKRMTDGKTSARIQNTQTTLPSVTNIRKETGSILESTTHNGQMGKNSAVIGKEEMKNKIIIAGVVGVLGLIIVVIIVIIAKKRRTPNTEPMCNPTYRTGNENVASYENKAYA